MTDEAREKEDEIDVDLGDDAEIEVVDDTPEEDRPYKNRPSPDFSDDDDDDDDEAKKYSENVQKRIRKLKFEYHEERRRKEEAERLRDEAVTYAQRVYQDAERLRKQLSTGATQLYTEAEGRLDAQIASAKRDLKEAYELGDSDKIVESQAALSNLSAEKVRLQAYKQQRQESPPEQNRQPQTYQQPRQQQPQPSKQAQEWASRNPWFLKDPKMTAYAFGVDEWLIKEKGLRPDTEEYYRQIDAEMRKTFRSYFEPDAEARPDNVVAPPSRQAARKPRTVRLTKTQVALARRLGVTPEQYAAQLMKEQGNG